jgi:hypothetical protein
MVPAPGNVGHCGHGRDGANTPTILLRVAVVEMVVKVSREVVERNKLREFNNLPL